LCERDVLYTKCVFFLPQYAPKCVWRGHWQLTALPRSSVWIKGEGQGWEGEGKGVEGRGREGKRREGIKIKRKINPSIMKSCSIPAYTLLLSSVPDHFWQTTLSRLPHQQQKMTIATFRIRRRFILDQFSCGEGPGGFAHVRCECDFFWVRHALLRCLPVNL